MSLMSSPRIVARALVGVAMAYALLFQAFFLGLTGSAQALDQHALCITDQAGLTAPSESGNAPLPPHDCSCPALCHASFVPPAPQVLAVSRIALKLDVFALQDIEAGASLILTPTARGPPLAA